MAESRLQTRARTLLHDTRTYWRTPPKGRYMTFKEIMSYAVGGIGAYFVITVGSTLIVSATNMIVGGAIGVAPTDMYILYLIATIANIPLTALRANMIDNTRGKGGKYRPYLLTMGIPTAVISLVYVWFPYEKLDGIFTEPIFGRPGAYVVTCTVVLICNLLLQFFFNFFNDAYTNLIHVLSPNTQERTDVLAVKSIVYSLAPSIMNMALPIVAKVAANDNLYDIRVYRLSYPVFAIVGILLTILVYANTKEKIVQAKTHTIQIGFVESFKEVAKNKYFWIIALAGWLGFLELAYQNILSWSYTYGHTCDGTTLALINTLNGNAAFWGMLLAPLCIRRFGKKYTLVGMNTLNIAFILLMLVYKQSIWWLFLCIYLNSMVSAFEQITTPAIQADIRDYQQYRSGERIDGMFATVSTIGNLVTLLTSSVLPAVERHYGVFEGNGYAQPFDILDVTTGEPGLFYKMLTALILMAGLGAFLNMVPYLFYDFTEKKQKSVIRVLKVRSLFEDYANHALNHHQLVEAIDLVNRAREMAQQQEKPVSKASYKGISDKTARKEAKKQYKADVEWNEEIEISRFVCKELDKFNSPLYQHEVAVYREIYDAGLDGVKAIDLTQARALLKEAKALPKTTEDEKAFRAFQIEIAKKKISSKVSYQRFFSGSQRFEEPDMAELTAAFNKEDLLDEEIFALVEAQNAARKQGDKALVKETKLKIRALQQEKKQTQQLSKELMDAFAKFNRAAKVYHDARKLLNEQENYSHFDEIAALYDEAKLQAEAEDRERLEAEKAVVEEAQSAAKQ